MDWLESYRLPDAWLEKAYESCSAQFKSAIKTAIALAFFHFGESSSRVENQTSSGRAGFWQKEATSSGMEAHIILPDTYGAAARLCAAVMAPLLANSHVNVIICGHESRDNILLTLELCGVENIYLVNRHDLLVPLLKDRLTSRFILLHSGELNDLATLLTQGRFIYYEEKSPPLLCLLAPEAFSSDMLLLAHDFLPRGASEAQKADAAFVNAPCNAAPLELTPGCECFWLFPNYGPAFFRIRQKSFGLMPMDEDDESC